MATSDPVQLSPATPADLAAVVALRDERAGWMVRAGIDQWHVGDVTAPDLAPWVADGLVHVLRDDRGIAATVAVLWADPVVWPAAAAHDGRAGYVHLLATARRVAGQGVGARVLAWAEAHVAASGRSLVRLDHVRRNDWLAAWYDARGYRVVHDAVPTGHGPPADPYVAVLREKDLTAPVEADRHDDDPHGRRRGSVDQGTVHHRRGRGPTT